MRNLFIKKYDLNQKYFAKKCFVDTFGNDIKLIQESQDGEGMGFYLLVYEYRNGDKIIFENDRLIFDIRIENKYYFASFSNQHREISHSATQDSISKSIKELKKSLEEGKLIMSIDTKLVFNDKRKINIEITSAINDKQLRTKISSLINDKKWREIPVDNPYWTKIKTPLYADKWYISNDTGCLWEVIYPDFPMSGAVRNFPDGKYESKI